MSPIESILRVVEDSLGSTLAMIAGFFVSSNTFDSKIKANNVKCPVLMFHGENDKIAGRDHSINLLSSGQ